MLVECWHVRRFFLCRPAAGAYFELRKLELAQYKMSHLAIFERNRISRRSRSFLSCFSGTTMTMLDLATV